MNNFETFEGRVLYTIYDLYCENGITLDQKGLLKGSLIFKFKF